jgi:hypothetical protein
MYVWRSVSTIALLLSTSPLFAVTYLVPSDREMIQRADDIVVATSVDSSVRRTAGHAVVTDYTLTIQEVLKGQRSPGETLVLTEAGGVMPGAALFLSGMPVYIPGQTYLVFTESKAEGEWSTWGLELGQFALQNDRAIRKAVGFNENWELLEAEPARDMRGFLEYIRGIVAQKIDPTPHYFVANQGPRLEAAVSALAVTRASYLVTGAPRWRNAPAATLVTSGTQPGADGPSAVALAISQWNATSSTIHYSYAGQDNTAVGGFKTYDGVNAVLFNDPNGEISPAVLARGGPWSSGSSYTFDGETFIDIDGGIDIVIADRSFEQACLNVVITHEIGHTFGLRHSNENGDLSPVKPCNPITQNCTSNAIMNSGVDCSAGASAALRDWDRTAVSAVYPHVKPPKYRSVRH